LGYESKCHISYIDNHFRVESVLSILGKLVRIINDYCKCCLWQFVLDRSDHGANKSAIH